MRLIQKWKSVIGLEVHAQIQSNTKLFSGAPSRILGVNSNVSLFDIATPGTLPVLNRRCVEAGVLTAVALNCRISPVSYFDRKHYFYADMPSGYQITQQRAPLATVGQLDFPVYSPGVLNYRGSARIKQIQLEQDSGKSLHDSDRSLVDLNRAGVGLMEVVFEPDLTNGEEAAALIKELIVILKKLQTCSCKMEEGALRVDANVSIHQPGQPFGVRTEIKNIGSVRGVAHAIQYEIERQIAVLENNGVVVNETRAWNPEKRKTIAMRDKEVEQDYRYMPEPNLPPLHVGMGPIEGLVNADRVRESLPELPEETRRKLRDDLELTMEQSIILVNNSRLLETFKEALEGRKVIPKKLANFLINDLLKQLNDDKLDIDEIEFNGKHLGEIVELLGNGTINRAIAFKLIEEVLKNNKENPLKIVELNCWQQITDDEQLKQLCKEVLDENPKAVKDYLKGKSKVMKAFMGAAFKKSETRADMRKLEDIFKELLKKYY